MKTLIPLLFFMCIEIEAQVMPKQSAGIVIMPDYGAGVMYSRYFGHLGAYGSYAHTIMGFSSRRFDNSQKVSAGVVLLIFNASTRYPFYFQGGTSYNTYSGVQPFYKRDKHTTQPFDLQLGCGGMMNALDIGFRYDVFKHEASVDLQWNFGRQVINHKHLKR